MRFSFSKEYKHLAAPIRSGLVSATVISLVLGALLVTPAAKAQSPNVLATTTGSVPFPVLLRAEGSTTQRGRIEIRLALYESKDDSQPLWEEVQTTEADARGIFTVWMGVTRGGLPAGLVLSGKARWYSTSVPGETESARRPISVVPYAAKSADASMLGGTPASEFVRKVEMAASAIPSGVTNLNLITGAVSLVAGENVQIQRSGNTLILSAKPTTAVCSCQIICCSTSGCTSTSVAAKGLANGIDACARAASCPFGLKSLTCN